MSSAILNEVDPFAAETPDEAVELRALGRALELAEGFRLIFARCNVASRRQELIARLRGNLPHLSVQVIHFGAPVVNLLDELRGRLATPLPDAVFVTGLENSLPVSAEAAHAPLVAALNASRNSFAETVPRPLVLWVPDYVLSALSQAAPDFFSVRSGVYSFNAGADTITEAAGSVVAGDHWAVGNLTGAEKQERIATIKSLLADYEALPERQRDLRAEMNLRQRLGQLYLWQGDWGTAQGQFAAALGLAEKLDARQEQAMAWQALGQVEKARGEYALAMFLYSKALALAEASSNAVGQAAIWNSVGEVFFEQGRYDEALASYQRALKLQEEIGHLLPGGISHLNATLSTFNNIGMVHLRRGELAEALDCHQHVLGLARNVGNRTEEARALFHIGAVYAEQGNRAAAIDFYRHALAIQEEIGDQRGVASSNLSIGYSLAQLGRYSEALPHLIVARSAFTELLSPGGSIASAALRRLRVEWGPENFDPAWKAATNEDVPDELK